MYNLFHPENVDCGFRRVAYHWFACICSSFKLLIFPIAIMKWKYPCADYIDTFLPLGSASLCSISLATNSA